MAENDGELSFEPNQIITNGMNFVITQAKIYNVSVKKNTVDLTAAVLVAAIHTHTQNTV